MFLFQPIPVPLKRRRLVKNGNFINKDVVGSKPSEQSLEKDQHDLHEVCTYNNYDLPLLTLCILGKVNEHQNFYC